ncbi:MAG: phosphoglycerate kinase [Candidatus Taylorbacteria bacterium]|nr:phosphoglycerate kinase [Candidatus Taylorbacteria bacterium]
MRTINEIPAFEGVRVLIRAELNVPIEDGKVRDAFRIEHLMPTLELLCSKGSKVIILSHIESGEKTFLPVYEYMRSRMDRVIKFAKNITEAEVMIPNMENGECLLVENLRHDEGEEKNDPAFAARLARLGDIYINNAFSVSHRPHASIIGIPKYIPGYAGPLMEEEVKNLSTAFNPEHTFLFVLGGSKFETKVPLIKKFLGSADKIFIGGALANDILKAKGVEVGLSVVSTKPETAKEIEEIMNNEKVVPMIDVTVESPEGKKVKKLGEIAKEDYIYDVGPETVKVLADLAMNAKFILWNGPLGNYEKGFVESTEELARAVAKATENGARSIIGGGDTIASIEKLGLNDKFSFVSTAGGAMLDFLANGTLPGIDALNK